MAIAVLGSCPASSATQLQWLLQEHVGLPGVTNGIHEEPFDPQFLLDSSDSAIDRILRPSPALRVPKDRSIGILITQPSHKLADIRGNVEHSISPLLALLLRLCLLKNGYTVVLLQVASFERSSFLRANTCRPCENEKIEKGVALFVSVEDGLPLFGRERYLPAFASGLVHELNRICSDDPLSSCPTESSLDGRDVIGSSGWRPLAGVAVRPLHQMLGNQLIDDEPFPNLLAKRASGHGDTN